MPEPASPIAHPRQRTTLAASATLQGKGLFTGEPATITFKPGLDGYSIVRADKKRAIPVRLVSLHKDPIHPAFKDQKPRSTNLSSTHIVAATVEHALSALAGLGVTDCTIELEGPEVPILDGSAKPFVDAILAAGLATLPGGIAPFTLTDPIVVQDEEAGASITAQPRSAPGWSITYELEYGDNAPIPTQRATWDGSPDAYARHIAPARTFCTQAEANALQAAGLF
ncbi:MAG: UDP-3-O-acyl-N-acetylglucosamine deacetylase, partial [Phycisphaerales bacterium JB064]